MIGVLFSSVSYSVVTQYCSGSDYKASGLFSAMVLLWRRIWMLLEVFTFLHRAGEFVAGMKLCFLSLAQMKTQRADAF